MKPLKSRVFTFWIAAILVLICGGLHSAHADATITVVNLDTAGEGFNDASAADPASTAGGNPGATLGEQRLIAFQYAADIWGEILDSVVEIKVGANFNPLPCGSTSAIVGSAGPTTIHRDFPGAPVPKMWYPQALANSFAGIDLALSDDISATFNSAIGTTCSFPNVWYYGLDGNPSGNNLDFVSVVLHELAHGLGFLTFVSLASGAKLLGYDDAFMRYLEDHDTGKLYPNMTNEERVMASSNSGGLHWIGPKVMADGAILSSGRHSSGHVEMYAPAVRQPGASVSHFSTSLFPNQLLEPSYTGPSNDVGLARALMEDIGWELYADLIVPTITVSDDALTTADSFSINATVENRGQSSSESTTLRYYLSTDLTISTADTQLGRDPVSALAAGGTSAESVSATAPDSPDTYWIGACVDSVSGESDTDNNCSAGVPIIVSSSPQSGQLTESFEDWPPEGWSIINNDGDCSWESNAITGNQNYTASTGNNADASPDWCGSNTAMNTELRSPILNFKKIIRARLSFVSSYKSLSESAHAHVEISTDGGATWVNLLKLQENHNKNDSGKTVNIDLKQYAGFSEVVIRFQYYTPEGFGWWQIDDVIIQSDRHNVLQWLPFLLLSEDKNKQP